MSTRGKRDVVTEGTVKASQDNKAAMCEVNDLSLDKLNDLLKYKAIVPSEGSPPVQKLEEAVEKVLNSIDKVLLKTVSKEDLPRLKNNTLEAVKASFLNKGVYSKTHLESLVAKGVLKMPAGSETTSSSVEETVEW